MDICIYCSPAAPRDADGTEHWVPRWLGTYRGADTLLDRLCRDCNERLGREIDTPMARTGPEALDRYRHGLRGRHGTSANPFRYRLQSASPPNTIWARVDGFDVPLLMEDVGVRGAPHGRLLPQIVVRDESGTGHAVPLPIGIEDEHAGPWLRKSLEERELIGSTLETIICDEAETVTGPVNRGGALPVWLRSALLFVFGRPRGVTHTLPEGGGVGSSRVEIKIEMGTTYARGMAKFAFHYALKQFRWLDGHDPAFTPLRRFILEGVGHPNDFLDLEAPPFMILVDDERPTDGHFLLINVTQEGISALIKTFVHSPYSRDAVRVQLATTAPRTSTYPVMGHHLRLFEGGPRDGFDGELLGLRTMYLRNRWGVVVPPG